MRSGVRGALQEFRAQPLGTVCPLVFDPSDDDLDDAARDDMQVYVKIRTDEWEQWNYPFKAASRTVKTLTVVLRMIQAGGQTVFMQAQPGMAPAMMPHFRDMYDRTLERTPTASFAGGGEA